MKTHYFYFFFLAVIALNACDSWSKYSDYSDFNTVKSIHLEEHTVKVLVGMPMDMLLLNDLVIILDAQTESFFHVFSKDNFNYLGSFIRRGRGPGEEVMIDPYFKMHASDEIIYNNGNELKIARFVYTDDTLNLVIHDKYDLPTRMRDCTDFFLINNNIFFSNRPFNSSKDYFVFNRESGKLSEWGGPTPLSDKKAFRDELILSNISQKLTTVNLKMGLIASVFNQLPVLRIYSLEDEKLIIEQQMADASANLGFLLRNQSKELINYYHRIKSTDEYIYALYGGFSVNEYFSEGEEAYVFDWSKEIHIWKWDGTPVMKLLLDRALFSFDVTTDNKRIIATSVVNVDKLFEAVIPWD